MEIKIYGSWELDFPKDYFSTIRCNSSDGTLDQICTHIEMSISDGNYNIKLLCPENFLHFDLQEKLLTIIEFNYPEIELLEVITFSPLIVKNGYWDKIID